jgi:hypothetical protein
VSVPFGQFSFTSGELAPALYGRPEFAKYKSGASTMRNLQVGYRGGAYSRAGTAFVGYSKQTGRAYPPKLITFSFAINEALALEFGNAYMRVIQDGAFVTETPVAITSISNANPGVLVMSSDAFATGDWVYLTGVGGMTQVNGETYVVTRTSSAHYTLQDVFGNNINTTGFGAYTSGGTAARIYTLATPYADSDIAYLKVTQSADTMSICCVNQPAGVEYPPQDLVRSANNDWSIATAAIGEALSPPSGTPTVTPTNTAETAYAFVITAVNSNGDESVASAFGEATNCENLQAALGSITVSWNPVPGALYYNVYQAPPAYDTSVPFGALYGFLEQSYGTSIVNTSTIPDFQQVPPLNNNPFANGSIIGLDVTSGGASITALTFAVTTSTGSGFAGYAVLVGGVMTNFVVTNAGKGYALTDTITFSVGSGTAPTATFEFGAQQGNYPGVPAYFQQRRVYAASLNNPDTYWMSQPGRYLNFDSRIPTIPSDAITGNPWSVEVNGVQAMVPMPGGLVVFTGLAAITIGGVGSSAINPQAITPSSQQALPQAYEGCSATVAPIKVNLDIIYLQAKGTRFRDLLYNYNYFVNPVGDDITELSSQLFVGYTIKDATWCEEPNYVIWAPRSDGAMLSCTYLKQQEVIGWARHDTQGLFQTVCSVSEPPVDALYLSVERFIGPSGSSAYTIERMDNRLWSQSENTWCVDCGLALAQPTPDAVLQAVQGVGTPNGMEIVAQGQNYSSATTASVVDGSTINPGPGTGSTATLTIDPATGAITGVAFSGGTGYLNPKLIIDDPAGTGGGFFGNVTLDNEAIWTSSAGVFSSGSVGNVIRLASGGKAVVVSYTNSEAVVVNVIEPIAQLIPGTTLAIPAQPGTWTMTAPVTTISGLNYLNGHSVVGIADGVPIGPVTVSGGEITLATPASQVTVGLAFTPQIQTLYLADLQSQGQRKITPEVTARLEASGTGIMAGTNQPDGSAMSPPILAPLWSNLATLPDLGTGAFANPSTPLYTGDVKIPIGGGVSKNGQVALQQTLPLPFNLLDVVIEDLPGDLPSATLPDRRDQQRRAA